MYLNVHHFVRFSIPLCAHHLVSMPSLPVLQNAHAFSVLYMLYRILLPFVYRYIFAKNELNKSASDMC